MSYEKTRAFIRRVEGGTYRPTAGSYDPNLTRWGFRQDTYAGYFPGESVLNITEEQWDVMFTAGFWKKAGCDLWPEPLDLVMADFAFNSGPKQALRYLQRAVGAEQDGVLGPETKRKTLETIAEKGAKAVAIMVQGQRIRFLKYLYQKSVEKRQAWDQCQRSAGDAEAREDCGPKPELAPISGWLSRVNDLGRAAGLI